MRLIDADALINKIGLGRNCDVCEMDDYMCQFYRGISAKDICKAIETAPTIDPVKHGKWIADKYTKKCSECESTYWMREGNAWNYCPNCGARNGGEG